MIAACQGAICEDNQLSFYSEKDDQDIKYTSTKYS